MTLLALLLHVATTAAQRSSAFPPTWTEADWVAFLTQPSERGDDGTRGRRDAESPAIGSRQSAVGNNPKSAIRNPKSEFLTPHPSLLTGQWMIVVRKTIQGDNNVLPLSLGSKEVLPPIHFNSRRSYFAAFNLDEIAIYRGKWGLRYGYGSADFFEGNRGATQLYLDARGPGIDPDASYPTRATLNRSLLNRWSLEYRTPTSTRHGNGQLAVVVNWLVIRRLQSGELTGQMVNSRFEGDLHLLTTRGVEPNEIGGHGLTLDAAFTLPWSSQWRAGVWVENLFSQIWLNKIQEITAEVATNRVEPDADGFLHAVPILQGRIDYPSWRTRARQKWTFGLAKEEAQGRWLLFAHRDFDWRFGLGYQRDLGKQNRLWTLLWLQRPEWQLGFSGGRWQLRLGVSDLQTNRARRATLSVRWIYPLQ